MVLLLDLECTLVIDDLHVSDRCIACLWILLVRILVQLGQLILLIMQRGRMGRDGRAAPGFRIRNLGLLAC